MNVENTNPDLKLAFEKILSEFALIS